MSVTNERKVELRTGTSGALFCAGMFLILSTLFRADGGTPWPPLDTLDGGEAEEGLWNGPSCANLYAAQYCCAHPIINLDTQQPEGCTKEGTALVPCFAIPGVFCDGKTHVAAVLQPWGNSTSVNSTAAAGAVNSTSMNSTFVQCRGEVYLPSEAIFNKTIACHHLGDNPKSFRTALGLSVFFGAFGIDRFYLGFPALGLLKLSTGGMFLLWWLLDVVMIATQTLGPADGSAYFTGYYDLRIVSTMLDPSDSEEFHKDYTCNAET